MSKAAELANLIGNINAGGGGVNRNVIINGNMSVAQRGTSTTGIGSASGFFTVDRFELLCNGTAGRVTMSQNSSSPSEFANSAKIDVTTADTSIASGEFFILQQKIEGQNLQAFAKGTSSAKPFAVSFYVKGNASATYAAELLDFDNSRQASKLFSVTTDWTRVELTFPADTTGAFDDDNASSLELNIWLHGGSQFTSGTLNQTFASTTDANRAVGISSIFDSTDRTFFITGVQLEVGQNPTEFEHEPFERTLAKCQRYCYVHNAATDGGGTFHKMMIGQCKTSTLARTLFNPPVRFRAKPAVSTGTVSHLALNFQASDIALTALSLNTHSNTQGVTLECTVSSGLTAGHAVTLEANDNDTAIITLDCEL